MPAQAAGGTPVALVAGGIFVALLGTMYTAAAKDGADAALSVRIVSVPSSEAATRASATATEDSMPTGHEVPQDVVEMLDAEREELVDPVTGVRVGPLALRPAPESASVSPDRRARPQSARRPRPVRRPTVSPPRLHPDPGRHVVATARAMIARREAFNLSCYGYLSEVYSRAGHDHWRTRSVVYREGRNGPYADLDLIRPGDWLYIVNHPHRDPVGTHSVLFVSWEDRARGHARVIEHPGWGAPTTGRERSYDVSRTYRIMRPVLER